MLELDLHGAPPDAARIRELVALGEEAITAIPSGGGAGSTKAPILTAATGATTLACPDCGLSYGAFVDTNRFGCASCYTAFEENLDAALQELHGARTHVGRMPSGAKPDEEARRQHRLVIQHQLDEAVADERYEDAARLRDELRQLEDGA